MTGAYWVMPVPVLSTAHLPGPSAPEDASLLYAKYTEGWFIYAQDDINADTPSWYARIREWAVPREYTWIRFDSGGDEIKDLPIYDWI